MLDQTKFILMLYRGNTFRQSLVNFPHKGLVTWNFDVLLFAWTGCWANCQVASDLRHVKASTPCLPKYQWNNSEEYKWINQIHPLRSDDNIKTEQSKKNICTFYAGIILCMHPANERWHIFHWLGAYTKWPLFTWYALCIIMVKSAITHYNDVIMGMMVSQITSLTIVYWTVYSGVDHRKNVDVIMVY